MSDETKIDVDSSATPDAAELESTDAPDVEVTTESPDAVDGSAIVGTDAMVATDAAVNSKIASLNLLSQISQDGIYLMGMCFILGSLCTVFVLVILDFIRRNNTSETK
ncbi:MAG: hypothetical protein K2Q12_01075 [Rickettsiales bacterium]|nr:hypothetical protein [Rickettsiales bacterium]